MQTKLLIDAIVNQTTALIASLLTAAGIRVPVALWEALLDYLRKH